MEASNSKGDARTVGYEGGKIHCLWRALEQGLFPFMMNEVGELTEKNKVFVAVCEAAVKPETFESAKWKGIGRPPVDHMAVYKACLQLPCDSSLRTSQRDFAYTRMFPFAGIKTSTSARQRASSATGTNAASSPTAISALPESPA